MVDKMFNSMFLINFNQIYIINVLPLIRTYHVTEEVHTYVCIYE